MLVTLGLIDEEPSWSSIIKNNKLEPYYINTICCLYSELQCMFDSGNTSACYYWSRSTYIKEFNKKIAETLIEMSKSLPDGTNIEGN